MRKANSQSILGQTCQKETTFKRTVLGDPLAVIYNEGPWRLNRVSPLYDLQYTSVKLKQYASKIRQDIASNVSTTTSVTYSVQLEVQDYLKYSDEDASGLMITVTSCSEKNNNNLKIVYTSILLSWGAKSNIDNATHLLFMLEKGEQKVGAAVKASLQNIFDCTVKGFHFTQAQLLYIGFSFLEHGSPRSNDSYTLCYTNPLSDLNEKLNLSCNAGDMQIIWDRVTEEVTHTTEQVQYAYHLLKNQIFHMIGLDITKFQLCEMKLPQAEIKIKGIVKMKTPELVNNVLLILNEISSDLLVRSDASISGSSSNSCL